MGKRSKKSGGVEGKPEEAGKATGAKLAAEQRGASAAPRAEATGGAGKHVDNKKAGSKKRRRERPSREDEDEDDELTLEDVLAMGGTQEDFDMLQKPADAKETGGGDVDEGELKAFMSSLGLLKPE